LTGVLEQPIYGALPDWVRHGALWRVLHRLYHDTHFPDELERGPVATDNEILQVLTNWHQNLAPSRVMADYHAELQSAQQRSSDDQIRTYVHGKKFFRQVVVSQALNHLFPPLGADEWLEAFRNAGIQPPPDLQQILDWVLSLLPPRP
jgi:hypothetical protein